MTRFIIRLYHPVTHAAVETNEIETFNPNVFEAIRMKLKIMREGLQLRTGLTEEGVLLYTYRVFREWTCEDEDLAMNNSNTF